MYMKRFILLIIITLVLTGCSRIDSNIDNIVAATMKSDINNVNTVSTSYKLYIPVGVMQLVDNEYNQKFKIKDTYVYLYVDTVSYYYKNNMHQDRGLNDYDYYDFTFDDKQGYMRITRKDSKFLVELCYNYAIIEVEVEESELRYAVSRGISILNSIEYNELVIGKYIEDNDIENRETVYNIPEPENKEDNKNVLEYIEEFEVENSDDLD